MIKSKNLERLNGIQHAFFSRKGGVSEGGVQLRKEARIRAEYWG